jgi:hypothetical protein
LLKDLENAWLQFQTLVLFNSGKRGTGKPTRQATTTPARPASRARQSASGARRAGAEAASCAFFGERACAWEIFCLGKPGGRSWRANPSVRQRVCKKIHDPPAPGPHRTMPRHQHGAIFIIYIYILGNLFGSTMLHTASLLETLLALLCYYVYICILILFVWFVIIYNAIFHAIARRFLIFVEVGIFTERVFPCYRAEISNFWITGPIPIYTWFY